MAGGEDEHYEREKQSAAVAGRAMPAGVSRSGRALISVLIAGQVVLWVGVALTVAAWALR